MTATTQRTSATTWIVLAGVTVVGIVMGVNASMAPHPAPQAAAVAAEPTPTKTGIIDPNAADPYNRADYPDVVRQWGKLIPTINRERNLVAQIAAQDPRCDSVVNVQITDHGSRTDRHYMAECTNLTRIYFDGPSLAARKAAVVRTDADMAEQGMLDW